MTILDIFKRKRKKTYPVKVGAVKEGKKTIHEAKPRKIEPPLSRPKKILGQAYRVLKKPHVTEKATDLTSKNQYIFEVFSDINKNQVKKAVEDVYGVDVETVRIINIPRKRRRLGKVEGWRQGYKKAVVKIREGQKIEVLPR